MTILPTQQKETILHTNKSLEDLSAPRQALWHTDHSIKIFQNNCQYIFYYLTSMTHKYDTQREAKEGCVKFCQWFERDMNHLFEEESSDRSSIGMHLK